MALIAPIIEFIKNIFVYHKMKIVMFVAFCMMFIVLFFPFSDLSDMVTAQVSEASGRTVYVQFDEMAFTMLPQPALKMTNVMAESPFLTDLTIGELSVAPSIFGAIRGKPHGRAYAEGLFEGILDVSVGSSSKINVPEAVSADVEFENFNLKELFKALQQPLNLPFQATGMGNLNAKVDLDPNMKSQPDGEFDLQAKGVQIPAFSIATPGGGFPLPGLNLEKLILKGKLKNGKLVLNGVELGSAKDDISAKVTGELDMRVFPGGGTNVGYYNLAVDMNIKDSGQARLGSMMFIIDGFIKKYSSTSLTGKRYAFRIQANGFQDPNPQLSPL